MRCEASLLLALSRQFALLDGQSKRKAHSQRWLQFPRSPGPRCRCSSITTTTSAGWRTDGGRQHCKNVRHPPGTARCAPTGRAAPRSQSAGDARMLRFDQRPLVLAADHGLHRVRLLQLDLESRGPHDPLPRTKPASRPCELGRTTLNRQDLALRRRPSHGPPNCSTLGDRRTRHHARPAPSAGGHGADSCTQLAIHGPLGPRACAHLPSRSTGRSAHPTGALTRRLMQSASRLAGRVTHPTGREIHRHQSRLLL